MHRIEKALAEARAIFDRFTPGAVATKYKNGSDPVTDADRQIDAVLRKVLLREGEGWLSEESIDDLSRLTYKRVWIVDPLDGTREFVAGIPEFCVSVAMVENARPVAGGICNPATGEIFLGSVERGLTYNGARAKVSPLAALNGAVVLASRSEIARGEWKRFENAPFTVKPTGSVAYKLALVAAGLADATFTLSPKHEWDIAGGVALVFSAGGTVRSLTSEELDFNQKKPLLPGLVASGPALQQPLIKFLALPEGVSAS